MAITGKQEIVTIEQTRPCAFNQHAIAASCTTVITEVYIMQKVTEMWVFLLFSLPFLTFTFVVCSAIIYLISSFTF